MTVYLLQANLAPVKQASSEQSCLNQHSLAGGVGEGEGEGEERVGELVEQGEKGREGEGRQKGEVD